MSGSQGKSTVSPSETAELEPVADEVLNTTLEANEDVVVPLAFNQTSSNVTPMVMVMWTLAIIIIPVVIILGWLGDGVIKLVRVVTPLMDRTITMVLEGVVWITEIIFGDSFDEYSDSYLEVKHLLRN